MQVMIIASSPGSMRRCALLMSLLVLSTGASAAPADDRATCNAMFGDQAIAACSRIISAGKLKGRELAIVYRNRCVGWNQKRDTERALADCDEAIRLDPSYAGGHNGRCWALNNKGEHDRAIADCNQAIRLDPKVTGPLINRGIAWLGKRDSDRAITDFNEAIRLNPKDPNAFVNRAAAWSNKGDYARAIADYDQALRLDPKNARNFNSRGVMWAGRRDYSRAIADYSDAIRLDPKLVVAYNNRAVALKHQGDYDRAMADLDEAIRLDPAYAFSYNNRGLIWSDRRNFDRAVAEFDQAIRLDRGYTAAYTNRGLAYERKGDRERARADFDAALAVPAKYNNGTWAHDTARERLAALAPPPAPRDPPQQPTAQQQDMQLAGRNQATASRGGRVALVIANADYPDADPPLRQPRNDAQLLARELRASGFDVDLVENQTKQQLREALDRFTAKVKPGSAALIYYSGYGIQSNRANYMIPVNAQIWTERDVARDGISVESVLADIPDSPRIVKLVIFDASRRNPFERRFRSTAAGLAPIIAPINTLLISAGGLGQVVNEGASRNSLFITELLREFRTPVVGLEEVFSRARIGVSRASDGEQVPWVSSTLVQSISFQPSEERSRAR
jgi:tetratricopeptide (TPR) repeat protein